MRKAPPSLFRFPGLGAATALFFVYLYAPIVVLVALSFNSGRQATIWEGFGTGWYGVVLANADLMRAFRNSLLVATVATLAATALATLAALGTARGRFRGREAVAALLGLPLVVPEIVTAVATLLFFVTVGLRLGLLTVTLAHVVFCIPFAYLPIRARLQDMDPTLEDAAMDLYANRVRAFRRVTLPLLWPGVLSGAMLAFIISLDDFVITYFVSGAGATTLPVYIFGMIRVGVSPEVNAVSALMLLLSILFVTLSWLVGRAKRGTG
jgi:spermidine/putrescine transport system permease protein